MDWQSFALHKNVIQVWAAIILFIHKFQYFVLVILHPNCTTGSLHSFFKMLKKGTHY